MYVAPHCLSERSTGSSLPSQVQVLDYVLHWFLVDGRKLSGGQERGRGGGGGGASWWWAREVARQLVEETSTTAVWATMPDAGRELMEEKNEEVNDCSSLA